MKKRMLFIMVAAVACSLMICGCAKKNAADSKQVNAVEALKGRGVVVLGLDDSFPPLGYRDDNN